MTRKYLIRVDNKTYEVEVEEVTKRVTSISPAVETSPPPTPPPPKSIPVQMPQVPQPPSGKPKVSEISGLKKVQAPMSGTVLKILCQPGQEIKEGDVILKLEAMKMETEIAAPFPGRVKEVLVVEGQNVNSGETMILVE
ncbi:MAG: biotin/lipoyl-binding protein [Caldiserica bacterium]|jgi:biotin carboxyl carrier protein|nr:biotin/lipoyl-binding protein [Caldisericota bacterium]MDH7561812.1 biotin/lipoyl-binding protein [Caldisericota bacterium]